MKIVADAHIPFVKNYFEHAGDLILIPGRHISADDVKDADILLVRSITQVDENLLAHSSVKFVGSVTAGADHLNVKWLQQNHIDYALATAFNAPPVADYIVSMIAALNRRHQLEFAGTAAVIGLGNVGKLVAERLRLLQFNVIECDPIRAEGENNFQSIPLNEIENVDVISLHVPLTKMGAHPTYHFIDKTFLQKQKKNCVLMNASRGAVIDSNTLLLHGIHLQWCLDVWEHEPHIDKKILARACLSTPHIAGYSVQSKLRGIDMIYRAACERNWIKPRDAHPMVLPTQQLLFSGENHHWQDIVLGVFNPIVMTALMRATLLTEKYEHQAFDEMRNQFTYRHEFAYTHLKNLNVSSDDQHMLQMLGFKFDL